MVRISELRKGTGDIQMVNVFGFQRTGIDDEGATTGHFYVGERPRCLHDFKECGISFDESVFDGLATV